MATSKTTLREKVRNFYLDKITKFLDGEGEEILMIKTNQFCFPVVDDEGNELFIKVVVSVPNGSKDKNGATIPFDGYGEAIGYETEKKQKEEKKAEKAKKKAEKIERDKLERQRRKEQQANKEKYREGKGA